MDILGFGGRKKAHRSKAARLKSVNKKLDKKIADKRLEAQIVAKRKRLSKLG